MQPLLQTTQTHNYGQLLRWHMVLALALREEAGTHLPRLPPVNAVIGLVAAQLSGGLLGGRAAKCR